MDQNTNSLIEMRGITKRYPGVIALNNTDFSISKGEIRALLGENGAGKSTLMKILAGVEQMTSGEIFLEGEKLENLSPNYCLSRGISMIHQEAKTMRHLTVEENIWAGREKLFSRYGMVSRKKRREATLALFEKVGIRLDPAQKVAELSVAQSQLVELFRAISYDSKLIIMDEPTSALAEQEVARLFDVVKNLAEKGVAIIFITHKLEEVLSICRTVTVLRDGVNVGTRSCDGVSSADLVQMMVNRTIDQVYPKRESKIGDVILSVHGLSRGKAVKNVSFDLRAGEILGFSGLMGSGRTEIMKCLYGADRIDGGEIELSGRKVAIKSPKEAVDLGIAMLTEDRLHQGCLPALSVRNNITISSLNKVSALNLISGREEVSKTDEYIARLKVKVADPDRTISVLSGGNQQKVLVARALMTEPKVLILDEPTRGIDVGAKKEIYEIMGELAAHGIGILMVSSELPELLGICDRILVVREGSIEAEFEAKNCTQTQLGQAAFGIRQ